MNFLRFLAFVGLLVMARAAIGSDWKLFGTANNGDLHYLDQESVRLRAGYKQAWVKTNYVLKQKDGSRSAMRRLRVNCDAETMGVEYEVSYSKSDGAGDSLATQAHAYPTYGPVIPDTIGAGLLKAVCESPP